MAIEIERPRKFTADEFERMVVANLNKRLVTGVGDRALVWVQGPARLAIDSVPEPDLALLRSHSYRRGAPRPDDVLLVVEVAESSLRYDQTVKLPLYAGAGVPEYWIVSVEGEWIEVCRSPAGERYRERSRAARGDVIFPSRSPTSGSASTTSSPDRPPSSPPSARSTAPACRRRRASRPCR